jgi:hypothetical protein
MWQPLHAEKTFSCCSRTGCGPQFKEGKMIKKAFLTLLAALLLLPLSRCAKSAELSNSEVNEVFNALCLLIDDALSAAYSSATAASGRMAENRHAAVVITRDFNWQGSGLFSGISLIGTITVDTDTYGYVGVSTIEVGLYDASSNLENNLIVNYMYGKITFSGIASPALQIHNSQNQYEFDMIIGTTKYKGTADYDVEAVGTRVTWAGTVVLNGKSYHISS